MDLIYMNEELEDIGVITDFILDLAFGKDENNFELTIPNYDLGFNDYIYFEGTEYGGIVDAISPNSETGDIVYSGRTWHGILDGKVLAPLSGQDYLYLDGEVNTVVAQLIEDAELDELFEVDTDETEWTFDNYKVDRYVTLYEGINKALSDLGLRLNIEVRDSRVKLTVVPITDYSSDDEWNSEQFDFNLYQNTRPVNHMVCLGQGNLRDRAVIHLFTDDKGNVQQYVEDGVEVPNDDDDYITDTSRQVLFGEDEVAYIYDYSSAEIETVYVPLETQPEDWSENYSSYYELDNSGDDIDDEEDDDENVITSEESSEESYKSVKPDVDYIFKIVNDEPINWYDEKGGYTSYYVYSDLEYIKVNDFEEIHYTEITEQPPDWELNYNDYYSRQFDEEMRWRYSKISPDTREVAFPLDVQPINWSTEWGNYYEIVNQSGLYESYEKVQGVQKDRWEIQTLRPDDWEENYASYYTRKDGKYYPVKGVKLNGSYYKLIKKRPAKWTTNYKNYYRWYTDGVTSEYKQVEGISKTKYVLTTKKPTDWSKDYSGYYKRKKLKNGKKTFSQVGTKKKVPAWKKGIYWLQKQYQIAPKFSYSSKRKGNYGNYYKKVDAVAPEWKSGKYYTKYQEQVAPTWVSEDSQGRPKYYYVKKFDVVPTWTENCFVRSTVVVPEFETNKYFERVDNKIAPEFEPGNYYRKREDRLSDLIESAIEKLTEFWEQAQTVSIKFNQSEEGYYVGDVVGAVDERTELSIWQPITKKIITVENGIVTVNYEIGEDNNG